MSIPEIAEALGSTSRSLLGGATWAVDASEIKLLRRSPRNSNAEWVDGPALDGVRPDARNESFTRRLTLSLDVSSPRRDGGGRSGRGL